MVRSRKSRKASAALQWAQLGLAAPQVVAHRLGRMAAAGPVLSARDRREFLGMAMEKPVAFAQSWTAMWVETVLAQQQLALSLFTGVPGLAWQARHAEATLDRIAARGLAPVRRKAVANARRLARPKAR
ncbi:polyhydroxyalkanoate granule-associated phasin [Pseudoxanthomonas suwonensis]|uniref:Uncharacterized protein n=1 Tax=Pseudoxanthomonas suwonensis TaxID=314722 RepID=A0A0E3Z3D0_9GAMM|nr:polyhydroxyalkanoate granule-associated phasin [Pseudoxanthomonas suwonensis]AKC88339.1 hypothetical protein WQ53_10325 [Pseudoxanthomonas suwonensis]